MTVFTHGGWLRCLPPAPGADLCLICFPHAGGSASYYLPLLAPLASRMDVAVVQYPGRHDRSSEPPVPSIRRLADQIAGALRGLQGRRLALFGHSMGALVAFEVALRLERGTGAAPAHLFASGHRAPSRHRPGLIRPADDAAIIDGLRQLGGTDDRVLSHPALLRAFLPALRSDYRAADTYQHRPWDVLSCDVTALTGDRDPGASPGEVQAWSAVTTGRFALRVFPGGHFYLREQGSLLVSTLAQRLAPVAAGPAS